MSESDRGIQPMRSPPKIIDTKMGRNILEENEERMRREKRKRESELGIDKNAEQEKERVRRRLKQEEMERMEKKNEELKNNKIAFEESIIADKLRKEKNEKDKKLREAEKVRDDAIRKQQQEIEKELKTQNGTSVEFDTENEVEEEKDEEEEAEDFNGFDDDNFCVIDDSSADEEENNHENEDDDENDNENVGGNENKSKSLLYGGKDSNIENMNADGHHFDIGHQNGKNHAINSSLRLWADNRKMNENGISNHLSLTNSSKTDEIISYNSNNDISTKSVIFSSGDKNILGGDIVLDDNKGSSSLNFHDQNEITDTADGVNTNDIINFMNGTNGSNGHEYHNGNDDNHESNQPNNQITKIQADNASATTPSKEIFEIRVGPNFQADVSNFDLSNTVTPIKCTKSVDDKEVSVVCAFSQAVRPYVHFYL